MSDLRLPLSAEEIAELRKQHVHRRAWPLVRNDPRKQADGYRHYCRTCGGDSWPCDIARLLTMVP